MNIYLDEPQKYGHLWGGAGGAGGKSEDYMIPFTSNTK